MVLLAEVHTEQDIDHRGAQFADGNMSFAAQMHGLKRLEQALASTGTPFFRRSAGQSIGAEQARRPPDLATLLRHARSAGFPDFRGAVSAVELVQ